ncbi:MAG: phytase [Winogradskyella sp.]
MIYLKENRNYLVVLFVLALASCKQNNLPVIAPTLITEQTPHDTDDPAIWINTSNPKESIVFGTDKDEVNGGVYAFSLDGKIIMEKSLTGISYPNNVDVAYNLKINDSTSTDIMVFSEREKNQIRLYSVPDMKPLDNGGFPVFEDEENLDYRRPMGVAFYTNPVSHEIYVIVSRKMGPTTNYLYQYKLVFDGIAVSTELVRTFGNFDGKKEIEAIAVDNELGYVYYSDEMHCIHKYYANPAKGNEELACFGLDNFERDIEGIAIAKYKGNTGYIIVSNQQAHSFAIFDRATNRYIKELNLGTEETDGCDVVTSPLGSKFPNGLFVSMTDNKEFYFHDLKSLGLSED